MAAEIDRSAAVIKLFGMVISTPQKQETNDHDHCLHNNNLPISSDTDTDTDTDKPESSKALALPCPRCNSTDTKFCYFNNYNVNQPRHFCRTCDRFWTAGGSLRNVPFGSGRRKNRAL